MKEKMTEFDQKILSVMQESIHQVVKERVGGYNSPLNPLINDAFKVHETTLRNIIYESMGEAIATVDFKKAVKEAFYHKVARSLIEGVSGSIDRSINLFKQDPVIKAKMVLAIEEIIKQSGKTI